VDSTVTVSVRDARASDSDRLWIESVYRNYLDDLAPLQMAWGLAKAKVLRARRDG